MKKDIPLSVRYQQVLYGEKKYRTGESLTQLYGDLFKSDRRSSRFVALSIGAYLMGQLTAGITNDFAFAPSILPQVLDFTVGAAPLVTGIVNYINYQQTNRAMATIEGYMLSLQDNEQ